MTYTLADVLAHAGGSGIIAGSFVFAQTRSRAVGDAFGSSLPDALHVAVSP